MPILQYRCPQCGRQFEELVKKSGDAVVCPDCGAQAERKWSGMMYSATGCSVKKCTGNCKTCGGCH